MGSTHSGTPSPRWAMIEHSTEEFHTTSSGVGGSGLPSPRRCDMRPLPATVTTTPRMVNTAATRAMMMVPPWVVAPRLETSLPFEQRCAHQEGQWVQARARQPSVSRMQRNGEASSSSIKQLPWPNHLSHRGTSPYSRQRGS
jgi:hypothetical protein